MGSHVHERHAPSQKSSLPSGAPLINSSKRHDPHCEPQEAPSRLGARKIPQTLKLYESYGFPGRAAIDTRSPQKRSKIMSAVRTKNTGPEVALRRMLHRAGYRYRLHAEDLPGRPDLVFRAKRKVIFVHGCFWHGHRCPKGRLPKSRLDYWGPKISGNKQRDATALKRLHLIGWKYAVVWQCELKRPEHLLLRLFQFLD
jgi:DNA mismatch endonuclease (patch repair protein)